MRHIVLGVGGIGGLIGGVLAAAGDQVTVLVREGTCHPSRIEIDSKVFGRRSGSVKVAHEQQHNADVLWVTTKSQQLRKALGAVSQQQDAFKFVVPLLNGIDHVDVLKEIYGDRVVPGVISVQSERVATGSILHSCWHVSTPPVGQPWSLDRPHPLELAPSDEALTRTAQLAAQLSALDVPTRVRRDAATMLWNKLTIIACGGVGVTAAGSGSKWRANAEITSLTHRAVGECVAVAASEGGMVDGARIIQTIDAYPMTSTNSLQRDIDAGRESEIDYLSGAIIRRGEARGIDVSAMRILDGLVRERQHSPRHSISSRI